MHRHTFEIEQSLIQENEYHSLEIIHSFGFTRKFPGKFFFCFLLSYNFGFFTKKNCQDNRISHYMIKKNSHFFPSVPDTGIKIFGEIFRETKKNYQKKLLTFHQTSMFNDFCYFFLISNIFTVKKNTLTKAKSKNRSKQT